MEDHPWVGGAIAETAQQGSAWNLFEEELLERLNNALVAQHPTLCAPQPDEPSGLELLQPIQEAATGKLESVQNKVPSKHRDSLANVARLAWNVASAGS